MGGVSGEVKRRYVRILCPRQKTGQIGTKDGFFGINSRTVGKRTVSGWFSLVARFRFCR